MPAIADIRELADRIAEGFHPERIILFGSHARGAAGRDSDVDLLIVMPYRGRSWRTATEIRRRVRPRFPLDLLVRSPEELRVRQGMGDPFIDEILREGKVVYEADHP